MPNKILVIKLKYIGDVVLTTPVFKAIKENFPESHVAALVNRGTEFILEKNPYIDQIITYDRNIKKMPFFKKYIEEIKFLKKIQKIGFDTIIDLKGGDRSAIISYFSGAKKRVGIKSDGFLGKKYLYTEIFETDGQKHTVLQHLEVIEKMGIKHGKPEILLNVSEEEKEWARNLIFHSSNHKLVHIHPTSRLFYKCWKDEYMAEVIKWFVTNNFRVVLTSSGEARELKKIESILSYTSYFPYELSKEYSPIINLAGKLTLRQLIAVSSICDMFFGVDTGPMHIAAALGKPTVALFGPSGAFNWGPWDNEAHGIPYPKRNGIQRFGKNIVIQKDWDCIPCLKDDCRGKKISDCLFEIKPTEVIEILKEEIRKIKQ